MRHFYLTTALLIIAILATAQKELYTSLGIYNAQNAMPFGKFSGLVTEVIHPGIEFGYGRTFAKKQNHEWFKEFKFSYFYHRYVQHGIPVYFNLGYKHRLFKMLSAETSLGLGYMHSVPATGKYKLNDDGEYKSNKGIGRMQATASFSIGLNYVVASTNPRPIRIFTLYQQRVQMPFVKSYVPLLPYNNLMIGVSRPIKKNNSRSK